MLFQGPSRGRYISLVDGARLPWQAIRLGEGKVGFETPKCLACWTTGRVMALDQRHETGFNSRAPAWVTAPVPPGEVFEPEARRRIF